MEMFAAMTSPQNNMVTDAIRGEKAGTTLPRGMQSCCSCEAVCTLALLK